MVPASAMRSTWAMVIPPLARAAWAMARASIVRISFSMDTLPAVSAVVPRIKATEMGKDLKKSHSSPFRMTSSIRSSRAMEFILPPSIRGSMNVPSPTFVKTPGLLAARAR